MHVKSNHKYGDRKRTTAKTTGCRLETKHPSRDSPNSRLKKKFRIECHVNTESCRSSLRVPIPKNTLGNKHEILLPQNFREEQRRGATRVARTSGWSETRYKNDRSNSYRIPSASSGDTMYFELPTRKIDGALYPAQSSVPFTRTYYADYNTIFFTEDHNFKYNTSTFVQKK